MILLTNAAFMLTVIITKAYKKWHVYYATMLFVAFCNLIYNFLCHDYLIWTFRPDLLINHRMTDLVNTFVLLPATTLLYLHFYPEQTAKKYIYFVSWISGFSIIEYIWYVSGRITYQHGWTIVWSIGFYFAMFLTIRLHHTKRITALVFSFACALFLILFFKVPVSR
ncbi:hypothetical protein LOZ80_28100 [Paenibacillus sp. HWE-109]|uniref:CBO0543 family protein n=1 Tax=Paenibacillus sp. HWE-109 TaxID=1306526 RepID=UPI001EDF6EC3|nr:CBO0543 family protein [Paenibacillus sp. HWE-109]UKS25428.1 hypothetical protein LOZ80_28100 [Paenibacillus sp. HWE-109]